MNFTATLIAQIITFGVLVWFVQRFLWGPLTNLLEERKKKIAEGLAAVDRGKHEQELAKQRAKEILQEAKAKAGEVLNQAQKRAAQIIDEAKQDAQAEGQRLITAAHAEIEQERSRAREQLREQIAVLVVIGAEKILRREVNPSVHRDILDSVVRDL